MNKEENPISPNSKKLKFSISKTYHRNLQYELFDILDRDRKAADSFCDIKISNKTFNLCAHKCILWMSDCFKSISSLDSIIDEFPQYDEKICEAVLALVSAIYRLGRSYMIDSEKEKINDDLSDLESYLNLKTIEALCKNRDAQSCKTRLHKMMECLNNDRGYFGTGMCDAILNCGKEQFNVHKCIAISASDLFKTLFSTKLNEADQVVFHVQSTDSQQVKVVLDYIYSESVTINEDNIYEIIACSDYFMLQNLKDRCCHFLNKYINHENLFEIFACAEMYNLESVKEDVAEYFHVNSWEIFNKSLFTSLSIETLSKLFKVECYHKCEELAFVALLHWVKRDIDKRQHLVSSLVQLLDYKRFSVEMLKSFLSPELHSDPITKLMLERLQERLDSEKPDHKFIYFVTNFKSTDDFLTKDTDMWKYDLLKDDWHYVGACDNPKVEKIELPYSGYKNELASIFLNSWYYVVGINGKKAFKLHLTDKELHWEEIASLPKFRSTKAAAALHGKIYVSGGLDSGEEPMNSCECYDPETNSWTQINRMLNRRSFHFMLATEQCLYVTSGTNITGAFDLLLIMSGAARDNGLSTDCYNLQSKKWSRILLPNPSTGEVEPENPEEYESIVEKAHVAVAYENCLYYVETSPGMFWIDTVTMWKYCLSTKEWSYIFVPFDVSHIYGLIVGDKLYAMCEDTKKQLCLYDCGSGDEEWRLLTVIGSDSSSLRHSIRFAQAVVLPAESPENLLTSFYKQQ